MDQRFREELGPIAAVLRPLLNRLVFYGVDTCRGELALDIPVRSPFVPIRTLTALTTSQLARLAPELGVAGLRRGGRTGIGERWDATSGFSLILESAADATGTDAESGLLEYATLLTTTVKLDSGDTVRIASIPAQLALLWRAHLRSGHEFSASAWAEEVVELVVRRRGIREDAASLPAELLQVVARSADEFAKSESVLWTLEHALPDARTTPGLAADTLRRFEELASLTA